MYVGEVKIKEESIEKFLEIAEDFQIEGLMHSFRKEQLSDQDLVESVDFDKPTEDKLTSVIYLVDEPHGLYTPDLGQNDNQLNPSINQLYNCDACETVFKHKISLQDHQKIAHLDKVLFCYQCDYQTTHRRLLKIHRKSNHEGVQHCCNQCAY